MTYHTKRIIGKKYDSIIYVMVIEPSDKGDSMIKKTLNKITTKGVYSEEYYYTGKLETIVNKHLREGYVEIKSKLLEFNTLNLELEDTVTDNTGNIRAMKAYPFTPETLDYPQLGQRKYNGVRCRSALSKNLTKDLFSPDFTVDLRNKTGLPFNVEHVEKDLLEVYRRMGNEDMRFDGELYVHNVSVGQINGASVNKENPHHKKLIFVIFDIIDLIQPQSERLTQLDIIAEHCSDLNHIRFEPTYYVQDDTHAHNLRDEFIKSGYEGIILRHPNGLYEPKRSRYMHKYKEVKTITCRIIDVVPSGKYDKQGMFVIQDLTNNTTVTSVITASHAIRESVLKNKEHFINKYVTVEYRERTSVGKLFHTNCLYSTIRDTQEE